MDLTIYTYSGFDWVIAIAGGTLRMKLLSCEDKPLLIHLAVADGAIPAAIAS